MPEARPFPLLVRVGRAIELRTILTLVPALILLTSVLWMGAAPSCATVAEDRRSAATPAAALPIRNRPAAPPVISQGAPARPNEPLVRIRLLPGADSVSVAGPARVIVGLAARSTDARPLDAPLTVTRAGRVWRVQDASRAFHAFVTVGDAELASGLRLQSSDAQPLTLASKPYPGEMLLFPPTTTTPDTTPAAPPAAPPPSRFDLVEAIGLETYIAGVVARELPSGWELEAYKAQAIAARSYALHEQDRARRLGRPFDLDAGEADQVYAGATADPVILRAVRETRGVVLLFQGRVLRAYYSSTCGGRAAAARDVWPISAGFEFNLDAPLQGHPLDEACSISPLYRWSVTRDRDTLTRRLAAFGRDTGMGVRNLKAFTAATPSLFNAHARPTQYRVYDADGSWWPLSAEQLRSACNWTGSAGLPAVTRAERVSSGDAIVQLNAGAITITGRGFGHGVGLCQYGAQSMARAGKGALDILRFYYPGAAIERAH